MKNIEISPSILSADFKNLDKDINSIIAAGVNYLHFDVMDGSFVNNISFGIPVLKSLKDGNYNLIFDVHLMIVKPIKFIVDFINSGADIVTVHYEACTKKELKEIIDLIHQYGKKAGVSIKPNTNISVLTPFLNELDLILVMSVEPGFGGQKFMPVALEKIRELDSIRKNNRYNYLIEVDGGINEFTAKECKSAGVDVLVAGSYIFKNNDRKKAVDSLK